MAHNESTNMISNQNPVLIYWIALWVSDIQISKRKLILILAPGYPNDSHEDHKLHTTTTSNYSFLSLMAKLFEQQKQAVVVVIKASVANNNVQM